MRAHRVAPLLLSLLLTTPVPSGAQTFEQFGMWQYVRGGGSEAAYTESTDANRTFSLSVVCEGGEPAVELEFLLAAPGDDIGLNPDRFAPDGKIAARVDGEPAEADEWSFSSASELFVSESPRRFLSEIHGAGAASVRVRDAAGREVGTYSFELRGVRDALDALSCYPAGG